MLSGDAAQIDGQEVEVFEDVVIGHLLHARYKLRFVVDAILRLVSMANALL